MNDESKPERTLLQEQNDRLSKIFLVVAIILLSTIYVIYQLIESPSVSVFRESLEAKGFEVFDTTEQNAEYEYIRKAYYMDNGSVYIEFYEVDSKEAATSFYDTNVSFLEGELRASSRSWQGTDHHQRNYLTNGETFFALACYKNTFLYAYTDKHNKSGQDVIKEIIAVFMPPNLIIIMILFGVGFGCQFLGFGFVSQEKRKRNRCDVLTTATIIENKKGLTSPIRSDKAKTYYGVGTVYSYSPILSYYANNERFEDTYKKGFVKPIPTGTEVEILYNSKNPEEFCFADEGRERSFLIVGLFIFLVGLALCGISVNILLKAF